jgi:hypothetical protein
VAAVAICRKTCLDVKSRLAARDEVQDGGSRNRAGHLADHIGREIARGEAAARPQAEGDGRIEVRSRNRAKRIGAGQDGQAECERNAGEANAYLREGGGQDCAATATQDQPERADEFRKNFAEHDVLRKSPGGSLPNSIHAL